MIELNWKSITSLSEEPEFFNLEAWARKYSELGAKRALEIGSYHGKSTVVLAQFFNPLFAIDLWGNADNGLADFRYNEIGQLHFPEFIKNIVDLKLIDHIFPTISSSKFLDVLPYLNLDFVYIDGSHMYENVKGDLERVEKHLSLRGVIVCDDYKRPGFGYPPREDVGFPFRNDKDPWEEVARAIEEFLVEKKFRVVEHSLGQVLIERTTNI